MQFQIDTVDRFKIIRITGNIDSTEDTNRLDDEISKMIEDGSHHFVFNLSRTTYLDSAGISVFIHCLCDVQENHGSVFIIAQDSQVRRVLEMVGITRLIKTYDSEELFNDAEVKATV